MTMKSLLLGAAAGIAAIGAAQAADLPMTKGEAVEYVKVCSTFGPGFFYIPGSDTCLKIGGEIRADYRVFGGDRPGFYTIAPVAGGTAGGTFFTKNSFNRNDNRSAFNTQGRIWFDARTQTDWGLLRSYFQINADSHPISAGGRSNAFNGNTFSIDKAFIQFGGLTAGYAHSFFGFYDNEYGDTIWAPYYAESNTVNLIAYTAQFGGGFSATLSIEDGLDHRADAFDGIVGTGTFVAGGQQVPDVVGQLRYDADWGSLALQAAGHQNRSGETVVGGVVVGPGAGGIPHENTYGFAVGGTVLIKIPVIDGGHFIVEGQYADAATDYLGAGNTVLGSSDLFIGTGAGLRSEKGKGWSIVGELGGNITPVLNANLVASYIDTKYDNAFINPVTLGNANFTVQEFTVAGNLTYTIVKGLTVAGEIAYTRVEAKNALTNLTPTAAETTPALRDIKSNIWQAGIRLKRTF
ncbi:polymerase [Labrys miyagiensis]|uniref:Porin n=1 Tax=Labrys miyagiensis TaxID=346912 RepID=A0ABQ6CWR6_9HYPH|nr:porin [Labrys miyagiensis]GLS24180.1 polymerase [Labrys miyagiensis]